MRLALIGNHPDGVAMCQALVAAGAGELAVVVDGDAPATRRYPDLEEALADPEIDTVVIAGPLSSRGDQLRRSVRSERDVWCVHPADNRPDVAYEAALAEGETKRTLRPLFATRFYPAIQRLRELLANELGMLRMVSWEHWTTADEGRDEPDWDVLRRLGGPIVEVSALAPTEEVQPNAPLLVTGKFESGAMIQASMLSGMPEARQRLTLIGSLAIAELDGPAADGSATLRWRKDAGKWQTESFGPVDPWLLLAGAVKSNSADLPSWEDEIRTLELRDALRRSVQKRRASSLEFQEISEEVGSKGTLTLIGCSMIWLILLIFGISIWLPWIRWAIIPMLVGYLVLLGMNWLAKSK